MNKIKSSMALGLLGLLLLSCDRFTAQESLPDLSNEGHLTKSNVDVKRYPNYLHIDTSSVFMSDYSAHLVIEQMQHRILENVAFVNGRPSLQFTSAEDLNMDAEYFLFFKFIVENSSVNDLGLGVGLRVDPESGDGSYIGKDLVADAICSLLNEQCEPYFLKYFYPSHNNPYRYDIPYSEWQAICPIIRGKIGASYLSWIQVEINGQTYYKSTVNFEDSIYDLAFGVATVYYSLDGQPIGLYDYYDMNFGDRDPIRETMTRLTGYLGAFYGAMPYAIYYGITEY